MLEIVTLYRTSRGEFLSRADAMKNRVRVNDDRAPDFGQKEPILEFKALKNNTPDGAEYFYLNLIKL